MPAVKAVLGQQGIVDGTDYRGAPVLAALRAIPDSPWFLVARIDTAEVFAPMRARLWQVVVMICVLIFGSAACVGLVWRQQQARFYRAQYESAEALRRSETKFHTLYNSTRDAVMLLDEKGFFDCNQATLAVFGCATREEFCSKHPADVSPPMQPDGTDSLTRANQGIATALKKGSDHFEWMHKRVDTGETFPAEVLLSAMELDGKPVLQAVVRDITARKRMEEKLRQLSRAVEQSPASIVITNPAGDIEYVNPKFVQVTGYTLAEALGKNPRILKSGDKSPEAYRELWETITAGKEWRGEFHNKKKSGELYWESASISPIRDLAGRVTHYVAVKEDITARKQTEAERDKLIHDLQEALANVKSLSGLLPICASCKKIRDDKGYWSQVESYIQKHSEATFTHGICPDCIKKWYPDLAEAGLGESPKEAP
jgi:PAS domain S-box-containing protein